MELSRDISDAELLDIITNYDANYILKLNEIDRCNKLFNTFFIKPNEQIVLKNDSTIDMSDDINNIEMYKWLPIKLVIRKQHDACIRQKCAEIIRRYKNHIHVLVIELMCDEYMDVISDIPILDIECGYKPITLPNFTRLKQISISGCYVNVLSLKDVKIAKINVLKEMSELPKFTQLEDIELSACHNLTNSSLTNITGAKNVKIVKCPCLTELPKFDRLESIELLWNDNLTNESLSNITSATRVTIYECLKITSLPKFNNLEYIKLSSPNAIIDNISNISSVYTAILYNCDVIPEFTQLKELVLINCKTDAFTIPTIKLSLIDCDITNEMLHKLIHIKHIDISKSNITELPMFTNLGHINISQCNGLSNDTLRNIIDAKHIVLDHCPQITELPEFTQLEHISHM